ncbi:MAG: hypothetical protein Q8S27_10875 [Hoeflea sp.]|nr:hypothetical protein [Hoeflea sp.]
MRLDIPLDLVDHYGTTTRKKSLRTKDESEAKKRLWPVIENWRAEFDEIRTRREITPDDKAVAVWQHYEATLDGYDRKQRALPTPEQTDAELQRLYRRMERGEISSENFFGMINAYTDYELMLRARTDNTNLRTRRLASLKRALTSGDSTLVEPALRDFVARHRLLVDAGSDEYRELCVLMMRAEIEGLQRTLERDMGDFTGVPKDPIVKPATGIAREPAAPGETIMERFDTYVRENRTRSSRTRLRKLAGTLVCSWSMSAARSRSTGSTRRLFAIGRRFCFGIPSRRARLMHSREWGLRRSSSTTRR